MAYFHPYFACEAEIRSLNSSLGQRVPAYRDNIHTLTLFPETGTRAEYCVEKMSKICCSMQCLDVKSNFRFVLGAIDLEKILIAECAPEGLRQDPLVTSSGARDLCCICRGSF